MAENVHEATDSNFEADILKASQPTLVDFWAEWCGPCKLLGPTIEQLAKDYDGKVKVFKMNVDENPNTPTQYQVRGIPTVILFKDGKVVDQLVGNQPKDAFAQMLDRSLT